MPMLRSNTLYCPRCTAFSRSGGYALRSSWRCYLCGAWCAVLRFGR